MNIMKQVPSRERCAEAGWFAYDLLLDRPMTREDIQQFKSLGGFSYLGMLKKPFFKVESDHFMIKGLQGDAFFRLAIHKDYPELIGQVESWISGQSNQPFSHSHRNSTDI